MRAGARVLGYGPDGTVATLREGTNEIVCLADAPADTTFSVACYHASIEPYMARGRALRDEGVSGQELNTIRWREMEEGTLARPTFMAMLYVLHGSGFDAQSGQVTDPYLRYVMYVPGATGESLGLPVAPVGPGAPWLMYPGTQGAHIMITPPRNR